MELFEKDLEKLNIIDTYNKIETPLGSIYFSVQTDNTYIDTTTISEYINQSLDGKTIYRWENYNFEAEFMSYKPINHIPDGMVVDDCIAVAWRLRAKKTINAPIEFKCIWDKNYVWKDYGANSGEYLDAQTWEDGIHYVTIGTEDGEYLFIRSKMDRMIPRCLQSRDADLGLVQYSELGLTVPIPCMEANETCHIQFVVSWGKSEIATWYAVGQTSNEFFV